MFLLSRRKTELFSGLIKTHQYLNLKISEQSLNKVFLDT